MTTAGTDQPILATTSRHRTAGTTTTTTTYVFDGYCPWSYGFSAAIAGFAAHHAEAPIDVVHGTLYTQHRVLPIRRIPDVVATCEQVAASTGADFGQRYFDLVARGVFIMDSGAAAIGFAALRTIAPHASVSLALAMQLAFFRDGLSLSDAGTYRRIAEEHRLDVSRVNELLNDRSTRRGARIDAVRCADLGVTTFPALIVHREDGPVRIGERTSTADDLDAAYDAIARR